MSTRTQCFPEEAILARFIPNSTEDLPRAMKDVQLEEQSVYDNWRKTGELAPYCHGCPRIPKCYGESGFKIHGLRNYE